MSSFWQKKKGETNMTNIFTAESFGADLPENWEEICDILNDYAEEHPDEEPNDIWEAYWQGTLEV